MESMRNVFPNAKKMASKSIFRANLFMFCVISNHTVFLVQFEIDLHLSVFQKAKIALVQINSKLSITYTNSGSSNFSVLKNSLEQNELQIELESD